MSFRILAVTLLALSSAIAPAAEPVKFNRDIRPILSENCFACHGPDGGARQAGIRLDGREDALLHAIRPFNTDGSPLVQRIHQENLALIMPPVATGKQLTEQQKQLLTDWVAQGARYERHWSYLKPQRPDAPAGPEAIDHFIDRVLAQRGLQPVQRAERRVLARRLSLDLTGLPPDTELVESFVRDESPDAYERLVDTLLRSPHYGERMAVHWLDLVRYADTTGYHGDVPVSVFPFRDYIVRSFNDNKPFDVMTREQLAGDLLEDPTPWQLVASGYNRLSRMTNEGGAQAKEYLTKYATDRVRNVSTVWLGSTLGCAECHDHKFDPFLAKDFYSMAAFFADIEEEGVFTGNADWGPSVRVLTPAARSRLASIEDELATYGPEPKPWPDFPDDNLAEVADYLHADLHLWKVLDPNRLRPDCSHPEFDHCGRFTLEEQKDAVVRLTLAGEKAPTKSMDRVEIPQSELPERMTAVALELFPTGDYASFALSEFEVHLLGREFWPVKIPLRDLIPDHEEEGSLLRYTVDGNLHTSWNGTWQAGDDSRLAVFTFAEPLHPLPGERLQVTLTGYSRNGLGLPSRFRLLGSVADFPELPSVGPLRAALLTRGERSAGLTDALRAAALRLGSHRPDWQRVRVLERRRKELLDSAHESLVARAVAEPRQVRVLPRGNWMDDSGEMVQPQVPDFLGPLETGGRRLTRLDLANWLTDPNNPLTARVFVNRLWKMFFGTGLSKVLDDVGSQGELPANQELLDWLAVEFVENGWNVRHIVKTMLMSQAYQRSSYPSSELLAADPYNRLHGRQSMIRLDAEFLRDSALAVGGLLNRAMGGPSVKPYQPLGYYQELNFPKRVYVQDMDSNQYRRGLYTHWQRQYVHPALMAFDAPSREECAAQRGVSNTPQQALVLLNDPTYVEAARAFAERILREAGGGKDRLGVAFRIAFARPPKPEERKLLLGLLSRYRKHYRQNPESATGLLYTGMLPLPDDIVGEDLAAWTTVARALLNKQEFLVRY